MRIAVATAMLGSLLLVVSPTPATAHADLVKSSPRNGSTVTTSPSTITLTFGEDITPQSIPPAVSDTASRAQATTVDIGVSWAGPRLTLTPRRPLSRGPVVVSYRVVSADGHPVEGAIAFVLGSAGPRGKAQPLDAKPHVATTISGSRPGTLTVTFAKPASSGEVVWSNNETTITWPVTGQGKTSRATGVLPTAGNWQMRATLQTPAVLVITGDVTLSR